MSDRTVTVHAPLACAPSPSAFGDYDVRGDYPPPPLASAGDLQALSDVGTTLASFSPAARSLSLDVFAGDATARWCGLTSIAASGDIDALVWPYATSCALTTSTGARTNATLGVVDARHALIVGGIAAAGGDTPATYAADLATGEVSALAIGLLTPRQSASVTAFGAGGALVAGGASPDASSSAIGTAEVYVAGANDGIGDFDGAPIALSTPRADHAAVVLASGATLLVGGRNGTSLVAALEAIDPATRRARTSGLATLSVPRTNPTALRLASGEILVAGGFDASGAAVPTLEWFSADATTQIATRDLVTGLASSFVALAGGGALAVIEPSSSVAACAQSGCDANAACIDNVWNLGADHALRAAPRLCASLTNPRLFSGSEGAPFLWTGATWMRWSPWGAAAASTSNRCEHTLATLEAEAPSTFVAIAAAATAKGPAPGSPIASPDVGLALWTDDTGAILGVRFDTRSEYATDSTSAPLLETAADFFAPDPIVGNGVSFDPAGGLTLASGASAFLADATFASVTIDLEVDASSAPIVILRDAGGDAIDVGGPSCALAPSPGPSAPLSLLHVTRSGAVVTSQWDGGASRSCTAPFAPDARVSIGLTGGASSGVVRSFAVTRGP